MAEYRKPERIFLKTHPEYSEKWVQSRIAEDTTILGLGDLVLLQQERIQPSGGRLDLLLQDAETKRRYEVELQLGATDETHIIRTIEYWDIERKRYPQYDHCAVLIAEDITSRFLNVVSLFNGAIPLIAIQLQAYNVGEHFTLVFTTVVDELSRGLVDDDESAEATPTDRRDWENRVGPNTVALADELLGIVREFDPTLNLKYNKFYIGLVKNDRPNNFVTFVPLKRAFRLEPRIPRSEEIDARIEQEGFEVSYDKLWNRYRIEVSKEDIKKHQGFLREMIKIAFDLQNR
ncbi:MAG: hypothetical protein ACREFL_11520 [Stellaceae bacterium]